jgi:hypothetical protein
MKRRHHRVKTFGHILRAHDPLAIGEVVTSAVADEHAHIHDATFLVVREETLEAYLGQAVARTGEEYTTQTQHLARLPTARFYRVVMD